MTASIASLGSLVKSCDYCIAKCKIFSTCRFFLWFKKCVLITTLQEYGKLKKQFLYRCISKIRLLDTEQLSKMHISLQVFFKDFVDQFGTTFLKNRFLWSCFLNILLIDFWIASNLKTRSSNLKSILERFCLWILKFLQEK